MNIEQFRKELHMTIEPYLLLGHGSMIAVDQAVDAAIGTMQIAMGLSNTQFEGLLAGTYSAQPQPSLSPRVLNVGEVVNQGDITL